MVTKEKSEHIRQATALVSAVIRRIKEKSNRKQQG